jgi:hypothetical protein
MAHIAIIDKDTDTVVTVIRVNNDKLYIQEQQLQMINVALPDQPEQLEERLVTVNVESEQKGIDFLQSILSDQYPNHYFKQTSYNEKMRYNFAGIGDTYDKVNGAFIKPMPLEAPVKKEEVMVKGKLEQVNTSLIGEWQLDYRYKWQFAEGNLLSRMANKTINTVKSITINTKNKMSYFKYFMKDFANIFTVLFCTIFFTGIGVYLYPELWSFVVFGIGLAIDVATFVSVYKQWKKSDK